ncbi:MAG: endonuclease III domain-containing protein [Clostridiales bacterium]|nr:endonuclease III domain-containing protein [Eubacteriales bacterium]MDH7565598.1 endonuclease III domain-containing protein [Clostridiales bacterium]
MEQRLLHIYNLMYEKAGPKNWWPADTSFEVAVGAILTQFVSWKNVVTAIDNLKAQQLLSVEGICEADDERLEELIRSTRFYKQKVRKLKSFCMLLREKYGSCPDRFFEQEMYALREELLKLYGIGEETADCIILYAAEKPIFVVDAYTRRIFNRLGFFEENIRYREMQEFFMGNLPHDTRLFNEFHAQIDGIGGHYCFSKKPDCMECPLGVLCKFKKSNRATAPVRQDAQATVKRK